MYIESRYLTHRSVRKRHHIVFIIVSIISFLATIISMAMHSWFRYCWWDFGLVYASSFTTFTNFKNESTISDVSSDSCESLKGFVDKSCPDFCNYIGNFEIAGGLMIFFGTLSLIFNFLCILFHIWSFFKVQFKFKKIGVFLVLPSLCYCIGFLIYISLINFLDLKDPSGKDTEAEPLKIKDGLYISFVTMPILVLLSGYGFLKTRIAFLETSLE